jgi:hypothetical protein
MQSLRRALVSASLFATLIGAVTVAQADPINVPPFQANDTGGIIAWSLAQQVNAKQLAAEHCASYGKLMRPRSSQRVYGGYISFACVWPRPVRVIHVRAPARPIHVLRVKG